MTAIGGAFGKSVFVGNTILLKISQENDRHGYAYFGGYMVSSFLTIDKIYEYISNMGNNHTLYSIAVGDENIYFSNPHFIFIKKDKIVESELLNTNESSVDPFEYHISKCGKDSLEKLRKYKFHSNYDESNNTTYSCLCT